MALATGGILDFEYTFLPHKRKINRRFIAIPVLLNGLGTWAASYFTSFGASPRTIALYLPVILFLELFIFGHAGPWGSLVIFCLTSFQLITLFSAANGLLYIIHSELLDGTRYEEILPISIMNIFLTVFFTSIKLYKKLRFSELSDIITSPKKSMVVFIYSAVNAIAVTLLTYHNLSILLNPYSTPDIVNDVALNMFIRDNILFFSTILMLSMQARQMQADSRVKDIASRNIALEKDMQLQSYIQMGLEKKNQELSRDVDREKKLRKKLQRDAIFRVSVNLSNGKIIESTTLSLPEGATSAVDATDYVTVMNLLVDFCVHEEHREAMREMLNAQNLIALGKRGEVIDFPFKLLPASFLARVAIDDDTARIYGYMDREFIWTSISVTFVTEGNNDVMGYFYVYDVDEKRQKEEIMQKAASTDALTGLNNRRAFINMLSEYVESGNEGALFMFDLDHFKDVNDNLGHPKGDELLKTVADILQKTFRSDDLLCRLGGDEFCAFAKNLTDIELIKDRASSLNKLGSLDFDTPSGKVIHVTFSIGIAIIPINASNAEELYIRADSALYRAKESGRNCYQVYEEP